MFVLQGLCILSSRIEPQFGWLNRTPLMGWLSSFPGLTPPFYSPVSWAHYPVAYTWILVSRSTSQGTQTKITLLGTCHLRKLGLPAYLVSVMGQALHNGMALEPKGLLGATIRFHDQPKLLENSLQILEGVWSEILLIPIQSFAFKFEVEIKAFRNF